MAQAMPLVEARHLTDRTRTLPRPCEKYGEHGETDALSASGPSTPDEITADWLP
jgi:hypothetical protein